MTAPNPEKPKYDRQARWRERNQMATWAHSAVRSAIRRGLIVKQPCEVCGDANSEFHHDPAAYDQPLRGQWLCRSDHKRVHAKLKAERCQ